MLTRIITFIFISLCLYAQPIKRFAHKESVSGSVVVRLKRGTPSSVISDIIPTALITPLKMHDTYLVVVGSANPSLLTVDPRVVFVEDHGSGHSDQVGVPNDTDYSSQYQLTTINAQAAWSIYPGAYLTASSAGNGAARTLLVITDSGADCNHSDYVNLGGSSIDTALGGQINVALSHAYVATVTPSPCAPWMDDLGHGTEVSGMSSAATNNANGVAGAAFPLSLVMFKTLNNLDSCLFTNVAQSIEDGSDIARIVSCSCGGAGYSQVMQVAARYAWQMNTGFVEAAGNSSTNATSTANMNFTVGASASTLYSTIASFSNYGPNTRIAAPGVGIFTMELGGGYESIDGTSFSAPLVASVVGLMFAYDPTTSAAAIFQQIEQTAVSQVSGGGKDPYFGYGILDAHAALSNTPRAGNVNGGFTGQVITSEEQPIAGATVTLGANTVTSDVNGLFQINNVAAGAYALTASASGYSTITLNAVVPPGADAMMDLVLGQSYASITGKVTSRGVAAPYKIVQAIQGGLILATADTDSSGNYTLWVPSGAYTIRSTTVKQGWAQGNVSTGGVANLELNPQGKVMPIIW